MARKKSGGFNKVLEFIGLVDDVDPRDSYGEEYQSDNYGRQDAYAPQREASRPNPPRRQQDIAPRRQSYEPTRVPRMTRSTYNGRFGSTADRRDMDRNPADYDRPSASRAAAPQPRRSAFIERVDTGRANRYDYSPRPAGTTSRFGSLNNENESAGYGEGGLPQRREGNRGSRQRTVMYSVNALEDCCDVINNLLSNNTVIITMDALDANLMQRVVDTLSGAVFALHATIRKASDHTYLIAPATVDVNDDPYRFDRMDRAY